MKNNCYKILGTILGIMSIVMLTLGGYFIYNEIIKKDNSKEISKPTPTATPVPSEAQNLSNKEELSFNDETVQKLIKTFEIMIGENIIIEEGRKPTFLNDSNGNRLRLAYYNLPRALIKTGNCNNYYWNDWSYSACGTVDDESNYIEYSNEKRKNQITNIIEESDLQEKYNELFGTNYEYRAEGIVVDYVLCYHYDEKSKEYVMHRCGSGTTGAPGINKFLEAYKENDELIIKTEYQDEMNHISKEVLTYEFKLENGNYTFVKVTESNK